MSENSNSRKLDPNEPNLSQEDSGDSHGVDRLLQKYFGFGKFRNLQRDIVQANLSGEDLVALLPTGAGKSLCYQLPAVARTGLTLVISPLIALMKDQVDALDQIGIAATFLNSSLDEGQGSIRWRGLYEGKYRILYISPERLAAGDMFSCLANWKLASIAVDEAHCISAWGHDFRPEYRSLSKLRQIFPNIPIMALTATATPRVCDDIVQSLGLLSPRIFRASFNRPNLSYRIVPRANAIAQITEILEEHPGESAIIYCMTRNRTEELAEALVAKGISAVSYHAGFESCEREKRQDKFIRDEVQVIVATIAFGMGIDKPDVRVVIHHDLPKNVESYYQETGRAGRDGLPSECILLYNAGDAARIQYFITQMNDQQEQLQARNHLKQLIEFCETSDCRRSTLLRHFGEVYRDENGRELSECGSCDNCLTPRETIDVAEFAQMLLSCVVRIERNGSFSVGLSHVIDVLRGSNSEKVRKWGHQKLPTFGIGKRLAKSEWLYYGREFIRLGLIRQFEERFNVLGITQSGIEVLKGKQQVLVRRPMTSVKLESEKRKQQKSRTGFQNYDEDLFEKLRSWRITTARARRVPAYMIFSDATLQQIARERPGTLEGLIEISGVGEKKLQLYGESILEIVLS